MSDDKMDEDANDDFGLNSLLEADPSIEGGAPVNTLLFVHFSSKNKCF